MWTTICEFFKPNLYTETSLCGTFASTSLWMLTGSLATMLATLMVLDYVYTAGRTSFTQQGMLAVDEVIPL